MFGNNKPVSGVYIHMFFGDHNKLERGERREERGERREER